MPKRGENIYKRKDGRWEGRYIRGRTASGQAEYGYVYADSYKACRAKRQQCIETLPEKPAVQASAATLAQAAELFLSEKSHVLKASSWNRYSYLTQHYILPALGTAPICQLTADQFSKCQRFSAVHRISTKIEHGQSAQHIETSERILGVHTKLLRFQRRIDYSSCTPKEAATCLFLKRGSYRHGCSGKKSIFIAPRYCYFCCCRQFGTESWGHCSLNTLGH